MNVIFVSHTADLKGGAERSLLEIVTRLKNKDGLDIRVVVPSKGELSKALSIKEIKYTVLPYAWSLDDKSQTKRYRNNKKITDGVNLQKIKKYLERESPDVVVTNSSVVPWFAYLCKQIGIPHIWFMREQASEDRAHYYPNNITALQFIDDFGGTLIANSHFIKEFYEVNLKRTNIEVIYPIIDSSVLDYSTPLVIDRSAKLLLLGTIAPAKNQLEVIKAIGILKKRKIINFHLAIIGPVGSQSYFKTILRYIDDYGLSELVSIKDYIPNPYPEIIKHHVSIIPSIEEPFGRVTIESMLLQRAVIASRSGGNVEIINKENENGLLYTLGRPEDLANSLEKILNNPELLQSISRGGYKRVKQDFIEKDQINEFLAILKRVSHEAVKRSPDWIASTLIESVSTIPRIQKENSKFSKRSNELSKSNLESKEVINHLTHELNAVKNSRTYKVLVLVRKFTSQLKRFFNFFVLVIRRE